MNIKQIHIIHMQHNTKAEEASNSSYSLVYYYLLAGIALVVAVFLFLPRISY